ncbi:MAG TPA: porin [Gammaproteobacteria bacterium]|jgi:predicted porin|nr:porin [Gammaproteobacteria bacterium]HET7547760.1 porin [Usitatibacter sp.]
MAYRIGAGLALAVLGCTATLAFAQEEPVTLYGRLHVHVESVHASGGGKPEVVRRTRVTDQASLLGVRGGEKLSRDLHVFYQLETGFDPQGGGGSFATRNSGVGLRGSWGSVLVGRWDSPYKTANIAVDKFHDVTIAGIKSANEDRGNFDNRLQNVVQYWSPSFAGFSVRGAVTSNETRTNSLDPRIWAASLAYRKGPYYAFYAHEEHRDQKASLPKETGDSVGGKLRFGPVELGGVLQRYEKTNLEDKHSYLVSVDYHLGKSELIYQYQNAQGGGAPGGEEPDCDVNSVAYQYNFSKRTFMLALYTSIDNNDTGDCRFGAGGIGGVGQDSDGVSVGLRHVF